MSTATGLDVDIDPLTGQGRCSHIVKQVSEKSAQALVMESRINGIEVEALCGHRFVVQRDPRNYPTCQACLDVYHSKVDPEKGLPES